MTEQDNNLPEELRGAPTQEDIRTQADDDAAQVQQELAALEHQARMDSNGLQDLLGNGPSIAGMHMRPITLATLALLQQIDSDLIKGVPIEECDNMLLDCCRFVRIQTLPLKEASRLCRNPMLLDDEALALADTVPPTKISQFINLVTQSLQQAMETRVQPVPDEDAKAAEKPEGSLGEG